jgi:rRNA maturation RNase YbeY
VPVTFNNADVTFRVPQSRAIKAFIVNQVKKQAGKSVNLSYIFCSDEYLLGINRQFLNHDYYTDIITFPLADADGVIESEIYISIDRVRENARQLHVPFKSELQRVIFHGVLHLIGYKDKTKAQQKAMREQENAWIVLYESTTH